MRTGSVLLVCLLLAACSGVEMKPGQKSHARRQIPPGPGILSGPQGEFVIYRLEDSAGKDEDGKERERQDATPSLAPN